jgi:hypothetical protein
MASWHPSHPCENAVGLTRPSADFLSTTRGAAPASPGCQWACVSRPARCSERPTRVCVNRFKHAGVDNT